MTDREDNERAFEPAFAAFLWWRGLNGEGGAQSGKDRAALARLRRASPSQAMTEEETLRLFRALRYTSPTRLPRVASLATVLASVRGDDCHKRFGRQIGRATVDGDESAALKLGRFKRLLDAQTEEEIVAAFRRAVAILGGVANVKDLAKLLLAFENEEVRRRLVFDYYAAGDRDPAESREHQTHDAA